MAKTISGKPVNITEKQVLDEEEADSKLQQILAKFKENSGKLGDLVLIEFSESVLFTSTHRLYLDFS